MRDGIRPPTFAEKFSVLDFDAPTPIISLYPAPTGIAPGSCAVDICGLEQPMRTIGWRELSALSPVTIEAPLICQIFNWSEAVEWEGVRLADFLDAFGIETHPDGYYAIYSRDGIYFESLTADEARDPRVLLAYKMNRQPLAKVHGGPLRLVVPFLQGYKSVKWVSSVRGFRNDPMGIKRLLGQSLSGELNPEWTAQYGIRAPERHPVEVGPASSIGLKSYGMAQLTEASASAGDQVQQIGEAQRELKEILTFIRPNKHQRTRQALEAAGVVSYTTFRVLGRGRQRGLRFADATQAEAEIHFLPKQCFSILVEESQVPAALDAILAANRTGQGEHGDGKVFVLDVSDAVRVSTDERGSAAI